MKGYTLKCQEIQSAEHGETDTVDNAPYPADETLTGLQASSYDVVKLLIYPECRYQSESDKDGGR